MSGSLAHFWATVSYEGKSSSKRSKKQSLRQSSKIQSEVLRRSVCGSMRLSTVLPFEGPYVFLFICFSSGIRISEVIICSDLELVQPPTCIIFASGRFGRDLRY